MKICLVQFDIAWGDPQANFAHLDALLAGAPKADLYVLPEMFTTGFATLEGATVESEPSVGLAWMRRKAAELKAAVAGSVALQTPSGKCANRFFFVRPDGSFEHYDKRHLFGYGGEGERFQGGQERVVVEYGGVRFLLAIPSGRRSSWQLEMKYSLYGAHSDIKETPEMNIRLHYIEMPIMFRYNLGGININGRHMDFITAEIGLSGDFLIKSKQEAGYDGGFDNPSWAFFSVTGNIGLQFDINDRWGINIRSMNSLIPCRWKPNVGSYFLHYFNIALQATVVYTIIHAH